MSVKNILKGAGKVVGKVGEKVKKVKTDLEDIGEFASESIKEKRALKAEKNMKYTVGPKDILQRSNGNNLEYPDAIYQSFIPYHINHKYSVPLVGGLLAYKGVTTGMDINTRAQMGTIEAGEGLSAMSVGGIEGASATLITPGLKKLNDTSTAKARQESARIRDSIEYSQTTRGAEGDIVFALHNMR
ncbi:MAG: hypothetical protein J6F30_02505 [Cellulosilyticum sp.]|nr:hypothetical protein [Cellulosilyticum sp.]